MLWLLLVLMVYLWQCYCEPRIESRRKGYWELSLQEPQNKTNINAFGTPYIPFLFQLPSFSPKALYGARS